MDCALAPWLTTAGIGAALSCRVFCVLQSMFFYLWYGRWYVLSSQVCDDGLDTIWWQGYTFVKQPNHTSAQHSAVDVSWQQKNAQ